MKILVILQFWGTAGGTETLNRDTVQALKDLGHDVKILTLFGPDNAPPPEGVELESLFPRSRPARIVWWRFLWRLALAKRLQTSSKVYDWIIFGHVQLLEAVKHVRIAPARSAIWVYGMDVWGQQAARRTRHLNKISKIISISDYTLSQLDLSDYPGEALVIPCCTRPEIFVPTSTPEKIRRNEILICGRMASPQRSKGHDMLFKALPLAERILGEPLRLRVSGTGPDQARLEGLARELGVSDRVIFAGRLPLPELVEAYQHCGAFCMPTPVTNYDPEFWNGEGFGIVYIEAASCGRPVIASSEGGAPETILPGETGLLVNPRSEREIAEAIATLLKNPESNDTMGTKGRELVLERFTYETFKNNVSKMLSGK